MAANPAWLSMIYSRTSITVVEQPEALQQLTESDSFCQNFTLMVGRRSKSDLLRQFLGVDPRGILLGGHGQAYLWQANLSKDISTVFVDYELQAWDTGKIFLQRNTRPTTKRTIDLMAHGLEPLTRRRIANELCGRSILPLCDTLCYFASDLGGLKGVASLIAEQIVHQPASVMTFAALPRILVVFESAARHFDSHSIESKLLQLVRDITVQACGVDDKVDERLKLHFHEVRVLGLRKRASAKDRCNQLRKRLCSIKQGALFARRVSGLQFRHEHALALSSRLLDHYQHDRRSVFSYAAATRPEGSSLETLSTHIRELLSLLPSEAYPTIGVPTWLSRYIVKGSDAPALANNIADLPIAVLFDEMYSDRCLLALQETYRQPETSERVMRNLRKALEQDVENLRDEYSGNVVAFHCGRLEVLRPFVANLRSHKSCLLCIMRAPKKVLPCGHALCDNCIRSFGTPSYEQKYSYHLPVCLLCGQSDQPATIQLLPPTAGVRVLSLDGGGVKGIIPLTFLDQLEKRLAGFQIPIRDHFDFVCGTSAGGLIAIGLFIMRLAIEVCIEKFESLAQETFVRSRQANFLIGRIQQLFVSYLRDCQYSSSAIEESFQSAFGKDVQLFNPLPDDTKVAITTTTAKDTSACIFSNYNGPERPSDNGYTLLRANSFENDVSVSEAASCTSAAPWFFKPRLLRHFGTFQDGGLQHNNPLNIAMWELKNLWPSRVLDFALSIGTGVSPASTVAYGTGPYSPVKDRFVARVFRTFMKSMDGERVWREIYNSLAERDKDRYHRLNLPLEGKEPDLDDVESMMDLKRQSIQWLAPETRLAAPLDSIIASMFYFEVDSFDLQPDGLFRCLGNVYCRLRLNRSGREYLFTLLKSSSSYFCVNGQLTPCHILSEVNQWIATVSRGPGESPVP
ncbi:hypothetical protein LTR95_007787 [Oleoguttula sp. CCFEE 5521]